VPNGWGGPDPVRVGDVNTYELGVQYVANQQITITALRIWSPVDAVNVTNRRGHLWNTTGVLQATISLPDTLPSGWTTHNLATALVLSANTGYIASYTTGGNYGVVDHGLDSAVNSGDGAVTALAAAQGVHGNGAFTTSAGTFPNNASGANDMYGVDVVYTLGSGSQPPLITGFTVAVTAVGFATATLAATDAGGQPLVGASYNIDWGDGSRSLALPTGTATHTYVLSGDYPCLGWVTDTNSLSAYAAAVAEVELPGPGVIPFDPGPIMKALETLFKRSAVFERVTAHEPKNAPGNGMSLSLHGMELGLDPNASGLASVAGLWTVHATAMIPFLQEPLDAIDITLTKATWSIISALVRNFTLGGLIRNVDLMGMYTGTVPLKGTFGYLTIDSKIFRVVTIPIPMLVGDLETEIP
jgi:hypothetical protein